MLDLTDRKNCFYWQTDRNLSADDYARIFLKRQEIENKEIKIILQKGLTNLGKIKSILIQPIDNNVVRGNVNINRKVEINGKKYHIRIHPKGVKNGYFYAEQQALIAAKKTGIPVPEVIEIHQASDENDSDFMLMSQSNGITMDNYLQKNKSREDGLLFDCGVNMAKIHSIRVKGFGPFDNNIAKDKAELYGFHKTYHDFIWAGLEENLQRLVKFKVINFQKAKKLLSIFEKNNFEPADGSRLIHNDMADWNLLTDGNKITAVLDWDECHAGDPVADIACWSLFFISERLKKFIKGYKSVIKLPDDYDNRFHYYRLRYTISKMALRIKRYQVDKSDSLINLLNIGKKSLIEESSWFKI